jgi:hypothetical protein
VGRGLRPRPIALSGPETREAPIFSSEIADHGSNNSSYDPENGIIRASIADFNLLIPYSL